MPKKDRRAVLDSRIDRELIVAQLRDLMDPKKGTKKLAPELEALGRALAAHMGMTDSVGGGRWKEDVADGVVSPEAAKLLDDLLEEVERT